MEGSHPARGLHATASACGPYVSVPYRDTVRLPPSRMPTVSKVLAKASVSGFGSSPARLQFMPKWISRIRNEEWQRARRRTELTLEERGRQAQQVYLARGPVVQLHGRQSAHLRGARHNSAVRVRANRRREADFAERSRSPQLQAGRRRVERLGVVGAAVYHEHLGEVGLKTREP